MTAKGKWNNFKHHNKNELNEKMLMRVWCLVGFSYSYIGAVLSFEKTKITPS